MHESISKRLEEYLGRDGRQDFRDVEEHLQTCAECSETLTGMKEQAHLLRSLKADRSIEPGPGFYARVMQQIEAAPRPSFWSTFVDPVFGRRLAFASMALFVAMSAYMVTTEPGQEIALAPAPEQALLVDTDSEVSQPDATPEGTRDVVLVQLTSYSD